MALRSIDQSSSSPPGKSGGGSFRRNAIGLSRALLIYGLLLSGALLFSIPFIWMIGTSLKVDREMFGESISLIPQTPVPASISPYLDSNYYKQPKSEDAQRIKPWTIEIIQSTTLPEESKLLNDQDFSTHLFPGIYRKLNDTLPAAAWKLPDHELKARIVEQVNEVMVAEVFRSVYRPLAFGSIRVRSFDLQEQELTGKTNISTMWTVQSETPAQLYDSVIAGLPNGILAYDFQDRKSSKVTLTSNLEIPFDATRLFRTQISIVPDDSWHKLMFYYEKNGVLYESMRPAFLGDNQAMVVTLQEYGPEDQSNSGKIRLWYACREIDRGPQYESRPNHLQLRIELTQSGQMQAWWAKAYRNYRGALNYIPFGRYVATSAFLVILNIIGTVFSCSLVAYAFARLQWPGRQFSFALMMATMMIPPQVTMIPYFLIIKYLGWYNTLNPLWVISFFGNAFNIFLLRQFMKGIPRDLEDAARIDGCNFLQVYWHVIMPLIKPTLACIAIFTFMGVWNDFMGPLIYLSDQTLYPLSLGLYALNVQEGGNYGMMMAGSFLMTLPVVVIFFFAQKYFIQGVTLTGMKG